MRHISTCLVCDHKDFKTKYATNMESVELPWEEAASYFLTNRKKAVYGNLLECRQCHFVFTSPQYEVEEYQKIYSHISEAPDQTKVSDRRFERLAQFVTDRISKGRVLDVGCGQGGFLRQLPSGFQKTGIDLGLEEESESYLRADLIQLMDSAPERWTSSFDVVTAWDVFEHLPDLQAQIEAIGAALKPDGLLFFSIPNRGSPVAKVSGKSWNCILLEHLWYFDERTLRQFFKRNGFEVRAVESFPYDVDFETCLQRVGQTFSGLKFLNQWKKSLPGWIRNRTLSLPIGLSRVMVQKTHG